MTAGGAHTRRALGSEELPPARGCRSQCEFLGCGWASPLPGPTRRDSTGTYSTGNRAARAELNPSQDVHESKPSSDFDSPQFSYQHLFFPPLSISGAKPAQGNGGSRQTKAPGFCRCTAKATVTRWAGRSRGGNKLSRWPGRFQLSQ